MKLNQVIALVQGKKTKIQKLLTTIHRGWSPERLMGISRTYQPLDEEGQRFPSESRIVQLHVWDALRDVRKVLEDFLNIVVTQEYANTDAKANIDVDGITILTDVPISALLFLEKQLVELHTLAMNLPILPPDREWELDENRNCWVTKPEETVKTQKITEPLVLYHATPEHPAQTDKITVDKVIGHWKTIHMSGAMPKKIRDEVIKRIEKLHDAVKVSREQANSIDIVEQKDFGKSVLQYIFTSE